MEKEKKIQLPVSQEVDVSKLASIFNHTDQIYKYLWMLSLLGFISKGQREISFEDMVDSMIVKSWYMTLEYHLKLGHDSLLNDFFDYVEQNTNLIPTTPELEICHFLQNSTLDKSIAFKKHLIENVPYRFLSSFINIELLVKKYGKNRESINRIIDEINSIRGLMYTFSTYHELKTLIYINDSWFNYFSINMSIVEYFSKYKMLEFLQDRNPSVPGLIYKIDKPIKRYIKDVDELWQSLILGNSYVKDIDYSVFMHEIYSNSDLKNTIITTDHYIPFSFVANDEFYNLTPLTKKLNSSKSNKLSKNFDETFFKLYRQQLQIYKLVHCKQSNIVATVKKCLDNHLNNPEMIKLYNSEHSDDIFFNTLNKKIRYDYDEACLNGFEKWEVA